MINFSYNNFYDHILINLNRSFFIIKIIFVFNCISYRHINLKLFSLYSKQTQGCMLYLWLHFCRGMKRYETKMEYVINLNLLLLYRFKIDFTFKNDQFSSHT